jgi:hypothetical protein
MTMLRTDHPYSMLMRGWVLILTWEEVRGEEGMEGEKNWASRKESVSQSLQKSPFLLGSSHQQNKRKQCDICYANDRR